MAELTVKNLKNILNKLDDNQIVYAEGGFGRSDIHIIYAVKRHENGIIHLCLDGHCGEEDREGTKFDYDLKYEYIEE